MEWIKPHYQLTIEKHSNYEAFDSFWLLVWQIEDKDVKKSVSDALNQYFKKHGPDANEDYTSFSGPLMKYETAKESLEFVFKKCKVDLDINDYIDGVGSIESDGRENDPVTGELLHTIPINKDSILDEIECLIEQDRLSKDDWVWLHFVVASAGRNDLELNSKLRQLTRKHR